MVFYKMETQEISDRFVAPCFVNGLEAYDGEINLEVEENMISNEFAVKLYLEHEVKRGNKVVKKELIVALRGEIYFVKFIINPEEDDVEPGVVFGRSFLRLTKEIVDFGNETVTIYPELNPFLILTELMFRSSCVRWGRAIEIRGSSWRNTKEERPVIETMANSDKYKKILDEICVDKRKLDGINKEEEEAIIIIKGETLIEKDNPGAFVILIRLEGKINLNALVDIGSDINVIPYRIYKEPGREEVQNVKKGISMLNHSKAELMGLLSNVLCQVGVTTIIAKFLILDMPIDRDSPILVGIGFLHTSKTSLDTEESDSDNEEEYEFQRNKFRAPIYGPKPARYLDYSDTLDRSLALQEVMNPFRMICVWKKVVSFLGSLPVALQHVEWKPDYTGCFNKKEESDGQWHAEIRLIDPYRNIYDQGLTMGGNDEEAGSSRTKRFRQYETVEEVLNRMGCSEEIDEMLRIKLCEAGTNKEIFTSVAWIKAFNINELIYSELCHEFYSTYEFDEVCADDELQTKKIIKSRLSGRAHSLTLLEFTCRLGLYQAEELDEEGFDVYFHGGLRSDEHFNAQEYWLSISREENLSLSRSHASSIKNPVLRVLHKMITYGLCQRITGKARVLSDEVLRNLSALVYCRDLDTTTLRELIDSEGRLIPEDPQSDVPRVSILRAQRASMHDLYERMGSMEIRQGAIERMAYRKSYHWDRYARVFEHMAGVYSVPL
ncbi:ribonuclease H-like domain-containing protein [Tanacetum coccineum]|uniref:Ribonuclease H-like domain-containing protein n=1 Tax=Tanacetum coccineum TaxID=301880 RepID=A0ABQ5F963_9ASTR